LDTAVPISAADRELSNLSAVVTYKTRYHDKNDKPLTLSFGLGDSITVNAIIGLPTFHEWQLILDVSNSRVISNTLELFFDLEYKNAATGLPDGVNFKTEDFIRPRRINSSGRALISQISSLIPTECTPIVEENVIPKEKENSE
jgi:hypothetical protein